MKTSIFSVGLALTFCTAVLSSSCSDRMPEDTYIPEEKVELMVSVDGIRQTRTLINESSLPDMCEFALFYKSPYSVRVKYNNGYCRLDSTIFLERHSDDVPVYALYPYVKGKEFRIDTHHSPQIDYLRGISVDSKGLVFYPDIYHPEARLRFDHILSRITVNIHKEVSNDKTYKLTDIVLGGDDEKAYRSAKYFPWGDYFEFIDLETYEDEDIHGELKNGNYLLETDEDVVTVDFLVLPTETTWYLKMNDLSDAWWPLPSAEYESGKQYIYDCTVFGKDDGYLLITEVEILPWENTEMSSLEASDLF